MTPFVKDNLKFVLQDAKILLGITGSIAAFKACDIIRALRECGAQVRVITTQGAENFVTKTTLETLSGNPVLRGFWNLDGSEELQGTHHIATARWADLILVAPATAHFIAKTAHGFADDLLSTEILAFRGSVFIAPAMNPVMYANAAVQENIEKLQAHGHFILGPAEGVTSCGEDGMGRMLEPLNIVQQIATHFYSPPKSKHAVITLGPTRSKIDPVRFVSNRSSGLMGASLCWAALQKGYRVTAICGPTEAALPQGIEVIRVQTAREMADAAFRVWPKADVFIGTAAVLDWDVKNPASVKLKKENGAPQLELEKNLDILAIVCREKTTKQFVLGFAAETDAHISHAFKKLKEKGCDAVFVNDVSKPDQGFESAVNGGWWLSLPENKIHMPTTSKPELARQIISMIPNF